METRSPMNLNHLRYFEVLSVTEHYGKAAEKLNISQPSLTYAISALEEELGVELFERKGRGIMLTRYGEEFLKTVHSSLDILESGKRTINEEGKRGGFIHIGSIRTLATILVPSLLKDYLNTAGKQFTFRLTTETGFSRGILDSLAEKRIDFGFTTIPGDPEIYETVPFTYSRFVTIVPPGHPLSKRESVTLKEALSYPQILFSPEAGLRKSLDALFLEAGVTPVALLETEEDDVVAGLVSAGFGVAVLPYKPILETLSLKILEIDGIETKRKAYLSRLKGRRLPRTAENFWSFSKEKLSSPDYISAMYS